MTIQKHCAINIIKLTATRCISNDYEHVSRSRSHLADTDCNWHNMILWAELSVPVGTARVSASGLPDCQRQPQFHSLFRPVVHHTFYFLPFGAEVIEQTDSAKVFKVGPWVIAQPRSLWHTCTQAHVFQVLLINLNTDFIFHPSSTEKLCYSISLSAFSQISRKSCCFLS